MKEIAEDFNADRHHREYSWDHANRYWREFSSGRSNDKDLATLHLAFYLASFGMYRGSGDLFERDYKALEPTVEFLAGNTDNGWEDCLFSQEPVRELAPRLRELSVALGKQLAPALARPKKPVEKIKISDTLLSKLMLVTLDCVPALDDQVKVALGNILDRNYKSVDGFGPQRMIPIIELARENKALIESGREMLKEQCGREYPLNRIFDLYLWCRGSKPKTKGKKNKS
jgi:hypothetical protein